MTVNRPDRILAAARGLVVRQGFRKTSMAQVATAARVAKGTAYSYWPSKEALFVQLIADTFRDTLGETADAIGADPGTARPDNLLLTLVDTAYDKELIRALQNRDADVLGDLLENPQAADMVEHHSAIALLAELLPVWRGHEAAAPDVPETDQLGQLELLALGYFFARERAKSRLGPERLNRVFQRGVVHALADPDRAPAAARTEDPAGLAAASAAVFQRHIDALAGTQPPQPRD